MEDEGITAGGSAGEAVVESAECGRRGGQDGGDKD